jgi:hypothetical protein
MVLLSARSLSAVLLALALSIGDPALCAGWMAQPDLPMACCADGQPCPMHARETEGAAFAHHGTQGAPAPEDCCILSGQPDAVPAASTTAASASHGVVSGTDSRPQAPAPALAGLTRTSASPPGPRVSRHVLLSVFLV